MGGSVRLAMTWTRVTDAGPDGQHPIWPGLPYAPMLCPVEPAWSWLKYSRLCNYAPHDAVELNERAVAELTAIQSDQELLRSFLVCSPKTAPPEMGVPR